MQAKTQNDWQYTKMVLVFLLYISITRYKKKSINSCINDMILRLYCNTIILVFDFNILIVRITLNSLNEFERIKENDLIESFDRSSWYLCLQSEENPSWQNC